MCSENKGQLSTCAGNGEGEQFARRIGPEFSLPKTQINPPHFFPPAAQASGPGREWHWTPSKNFFPFFNTAKWPPEGTGNTVFHWSTEGHRSLTALRVRENRGSSCKGSCYPGIGALGFKGSWALFPYHRVVLTPSPENRGALKHRPFCRRLSHHSAPTTASPVMKQLDLKLIGHIRILLLDQCQNVGAPRVTRQGQIINLKQVCLCLAWSKAIHVAEIPQRKWQGKWE